MELEEYLADPCRASSLLYWKTKSVNIPANITIVRDNVFNQSLYGGSDEPYFKMINELKAIREPLWRGNLHSGFLRKNGDPHSWNGLLRGKGADASWVGFDTGKEEC